MTNLNTSYLAKKPLHQNRFSRFVMGLNLLGFARAGLAVFALMSFASLPINALAKPSSVNAASIAELTILSGGARMPGLIYMAAGAGPHPTAVFLHGYPGNEKNLDIAQAVRSAGWNAVFFNYRGAWGAEGEFGFLNAEADVQSVLNYLSSSDNATKLRVDPAQLSLVGHSMGGHMAVAGMLDNASVRCAVAYDGANLGVLAASDPVWSEYADTLFMLKEWSGAKAITEAEAHRAKLDLVPRLKSLNKRHMLLIAADTQVIPMQAHITPIVDAVRQQSPAQLEYHVVQDDHSFSSNRKTLIDLTITFLNKQCLSESN